jgi:hypothetical protein
LVLTARLICSVEALDPVRRWAGPGRAKRGRLWWLAISRFAGRARWSDCCDQPGLRAGPGAPVVNAGRQVVNGTTDAPATCVRRPA